MSLKAAICDDCRADRETVESMLRAFVSSEAIPCSVSCFDSAYRLLASPESFDLYLLDIMMPEMSGMELAQRLRKDHPACGIVFITSSSEFAVQGYNVNAIGYLLKPLVEQQVSETFRRAFDLYAPKTLAFTINGSLVDIPIDTILFMESQLRHTIVYLKSGDTIVLHKKLEDVWSEARCHKAFARCHKSFVVNLDNAIQLENHAFRLVNGAEIPISRSAYPESKADYYRHKVMAGNRT